MENNVQKINFFNRLKIAIFRIERYGEFLFEKWQVAFIFFIILVMLSAIVSSIFSVQNFSKMVPKGIDVPEFKGSLSGSLAGSEDYGYGLYEDVP